MGILYPALRDAFRRLTGEDAKSKEVLMRLALHQPAEAPSINAKQASYVVGVLGLLIDVVGPTSLLATLLRQTRNEVLSLLSEEDDAGKRVA